MLILTDLAEWIKSLIGMGENVCKKMADLPLPQIPEKKFREQEIDLDQFTDEDFCSRYRFDRESIQYLVEILKNRHRETDEKT